MPGWTASTITDMTSAVMVLALFLFGSFHARIRKNQRRFPTMFLMTLLLFFLAVFIRGLSYYFADASLYRCSYLFQALTPLFMIDWMEQIVFEVPRITIRSIFIFMAGMSVAFSWVPENLVTRSDGSPSWAGVWEISGLFFSAWVFGYLIGFFVRVGMKAPWKVRVPMATAIAVTIIYTYGMDLVRLLFPDVPDWAWPFISGALNTFSLILIVIICVTHPEFLSIITYTLDRLIVIHAENGIPVFSHSWVKRKKGDVDLVAPLLQALQSMSFEVLKLGHMTELHLEEGNLTFQKSDHVIVGVISSRSTVYLRARLSMFIDAFEVQFKQELENPNIDLTQFQRAKVLIDKIFQAIPLDTSRFGPWRRHHDEKDYLSPDEDPELLDDLKSLFSDEL